MCDRDVHTKHMTWQKSDQEKLILRIFKWQIFLYLWIKSFNRSQKFIHNLLHFAEVIIYCGDFCKFKRLGAYGPCLNIKSLLGSCSGNSQCPPLPCLGFSSAVTAMCLPLSPSFFFSLGDFLIRSSQKGKGGTHQSELGNLTNYKLLNNYLMSNYITYNSINHWIRKL